VTQEDVAALLGGAPDILVPSHRDITRSVNEGIPIVVSAENSEAARAFRALAAMYQPDAAAEPRAAKRRRLFRRGKRS
jgi:MinD-like ATPase involved in chromosome partitioning or flagellar assembly